VPVPTIQHALTWWAPHQLRSREQQRTAHMPRSVDRAPHGRCGDMPTLKAPSGCGMPPPSRFSRLLRTTQSEESRSHHSRAP